MKKLYGEKLSLIPDEVVASFQEVEGFNHVIYGRVRNGKTACATAMILDLLSKGEQVYANWDIDFSDFDERESLVRSLIRLFFNKRYTFRYLTDNFHYFDPDDMDQILNVHGDLVSAHLFYDEGQWIFNSHIRNPDDRLRKLVLHGGHFCRSLYIITQRPSNIFKDMRSQINIWYKCEKLFSFFGIILFRVQAYEDMKDDLPDEEFPSGRPRLYFGTKKLFNAYNTHARRSKTAILPDYKYDVYKLSFSDRLKQVLANIPLVSRLMPRPSGDDKADNGKSP